MKGPEGEAELKQKAQVDGYEACVTLLSKSTIKSGQAYEIISTKTQAYEKVFRYFVRVSVEGKIYEAILDYRMESKTPTLVYYGLESEFKGIS